MRWAEERRYLLQLPVTRRVTLGGRRFLLVHATPRDPLDEYLMKDPEMWAKRLQNIQTDVVCVGHSHVQFNLQVEGTVVLNPGSVGQPRDGDPRAAYAVIDDNRIELRRVAYDVEETVAKVLGSDLPERAKDLLAHSLRNGRLPEGYRSLVGSRAGTAPARNSQPAAMGQPTRTRTIPDVRPGAEGAARPGRDGRRGQPRSLLCEARCRGKGDWLAESSERACPPFLGLSPFPRYGKMGRARGTGTFATLRSQSPLPGPESEGNGPGTLGVRRRPGRARPAAGDASLEAR